MHTGHASNTRAHSHRCTQSTQAHIKHAGTRAQVHTRHASNTWGHSHRCTHRTSTHTHTDATPCLTPLPCQMPCHVPCSMSLPYSCVVDKPFILILRCHAIAYAMHTGTLTQAHTSNTQAHAHRCTSGTHQTHRHTHTSTSGTLAQCTIYC